MSSAMRWAAALWTGGLLVLSYPPYDQSWLAWGSIIPLLWATSQAPRKRSLLVHALLAGGVWGGGMFYPLLFVEGGTAVERVGGFVVVTLIMVCFLFLFSIACRLPLPTIGRIVFVPAAWIGLEYVFRVGAVGFAPYLGMTQWNVGWALTLASYGGVHGVSALVVFVNAFLFTLGRAYAFTGTGRAAYQRGTVVSAARAAPAVLVGAALLLGGLLVADGAFRFDGPERGASEKERAATVSPDDGDQTWQAILVQPGFTPADYAEAAQNGWAGHGRMFDTLLEQTRAALEQKDAHIDTVVFWPETAVHVDVLALADYRRAVARLAREFDVGLVLGVPRPLDPGGARKDGGLVRTLLGGAPREYNSARVITPDGVEYQTYDKVYVIPIAEAEYAPGRAIEPIHPLASASGSGPDVGIGICSDVVVPRHARHAVRNGAGTLHYLSALSRIGAMTALERSFLSMRAAEHGVYVTQTATTGPTLVVDPKGRETARLNTAGPGVLTVTLPVRSSQPTVYTRWGDWPVVLSVVVFVLLGMGRRHRLTARGVGRGRGDAGTVRLRVGF